MTKSRSTYSVLVKQLKLQVGYRSGKVASSVRKLWLVTLIVAGAGCWFLLQSGGSFAYTSRTVLHGLCAQQPAHSMVVGGELLPFDSRMTGIYSGALLCWCVLAAIGRVITKRIPPMPVITTLAVAVALLAVDGFNSLFVDLGIWQVYEPQNAIRFFTGFGTGVALTTLLSWLIGSSLWKLSSDAPTWRIVSSLIWIVPMSVLSYLSLNFAPSWSYPVIAIALMASAWITVTGLVLVIIVSMFRIEYKVTSLTKLHVPLAASAALGLAVILGLAQGRFWLEGTLGIPQDFIAAVPESLAAILFF